MFALSKNDYTDKFKKYSRAIFSNPPAFPISIVNKLFDDKKEFNSYVSELNDKIKLLDERASIFIDEAKKCKLVHCEYRGGFFILIPCKNSIDVYNKLKKQNIYIAPLDGGIRIAISYITKKEIRNLAKKIHDAMQSN
jgi:aromatic-amino-acid transaminase